MTTGICAEEVQPITTNSATEATSQPESRGKVTFFIRYLLISERLVSSEPASEE
nr:MAG TPA: hypothetical protein [Caudoviricetes sp.]